jgi:hypothetical protein
VKEYLNKVFSSLRRVAIASVANGMAAHMVFAVPSSNLIVVPPAELPAAARQSGEAMLLHETIDGTTLLYIEQNQGARLAIFDVSDPAHIKSIGSVEVDAPGPFDFVSSFGSRTELVRFRQDQGNAVLDLHKAKVPTLKAVQAPTLKGASMPLDKVGVAVSRRAEADSQLARDNPVQVVNTANPPELNRVFNPNGIREELTKYDTGTTFLLTDDGLFLIRRPVNEMTKTLRDLDYTN